MLVSRRAILRGIIAAPIIVSTPELLMKLAPRNPALPNFRWEQMQRMIELARKYRVAPITVDGKEYYQIMIHPSQVAMIRAYA